MILDDEVKEMRSACLCGRVQRFAGECLFDGAENAVKLVAAFTAEEVRRFIAAGERSPQIGDHRACVLEREFTYRRY